MPNTLDHAFFFLLAACLPIWGAFFSARRLRRALAGDVPRVRLSTYRRAIAIQWTLAAALGLMWGAQHRDWAWLGLMPRITPGLIGVTVGMSIASVFLVRQRNAAIADDDTLAHVRSRLGRLEMLLPRTRCELAWFLGLSITAGVCEELLYRGFLIWYLGHGFGWFSSLVAGALIFGVGHAYQGWRGVLLTAAAGLFFGLVYWITRSLFASMILHALMDAHSGHLAYVAFNRAPAPRCDDAVDETATAPPAPSLDLAPPATEPLA